MLRHVLGVLAATIAAPYVASLALVLSELPSKGIPDPQDLGGLIFILLFFGTYDVIVFGVPTLLIGSLLGAVLAKFKLQAPWHVALASSIVGLTFLGFLFGVGESSGARFLLGAPTGAICGWIYWRIAIRGSARAPVP